VNFESDKPYHGDFVVYEIGRGNVMSGTVDNSVDDGEIEVSIREVEGILWFTTVKPVDVRLCKPVLSRNLGEHGGSKLPSRKIT
jgi:hypothetical protein